jgi:hypothetical protein
VGSVVTAVASVIAGLVFFVGVAHDSSCSMDWELLVRLKEKFPEYK